MGKVFTTATSEIPKSRFLRKLECLWPDNSQTEGRIREVGLNLQEYIAGTCPTNPAQEFTVEILRMANTPVVRFYARDTLSDGYRGKLRLYDIEARDSMSGSTQDWQVVPDRENIPGNDAYVNYTNSVDIPRRFFRIRAMLQ